MKLPQDRILHIDTEFKNGKVNVVAEWQGELVRCKDCKNWRESHSEDEESYCYIDGRTIDSTDYCSWGERKEP